MLKFFVIIALTFTVIQGAHLNYHAQSERSERLNCPKPLKFDKNFWSLYFYKNNKFFPHRGINNSKLIAARLRLASSALCYTVQTRIG